MNHKSFVLLPVFLSLLLFSCHKNKTVNLSDSLYGHWTFNGNTNDASIYARKGVVHGKVVFNTSGQDGQSRPSVEFSGNDGWIEIPEHKEMAFAEKDFTVAVWINQVKEATEVSSDIISQFDEQNQKGFNLSLKTNAVTTSLANFNQVHFGIDDNHYSTWKNHGSPDETICAFSMANYRGSLYAGLAHPDKNKSGNVFRLNNNDQWEDFGSPDSANSVMALAVYKDGLYAGTGKYRFAGSSLQESDNLTPGGKIMKYEKGKGWVYCGQLPNTEAVGGMVVYKGALYASSLYHPAGFYRYEGGTDWVDCGTPEGVRVVAMAVFNDYLYASSYDKGKVYRYDGTSWTDCGQLGNTNTQTYSFAVYKGELYVGTWPSGRVYKFIGIDQWEDMGQLGNELEVMGMLVYNGQLFAGTLPLAEIYAYENDTVWNKITQLDRTPDVRYRRAWTMAENQGKLFCSTLPSGEIYSFEKGRNVMSQESLEPGWHHITAIKTDNKVILYIDGKKSAESADFKNTSFNINPEASLKIGFGPNNYFKGKMADLRLYKRRLTPKEIEYLSDPAIF